VNCTGNTRVITQSALQKFQEEMKKAMKDPYKVVLNQTKLPISLLNEKAKVLHLIVISCQNYRINNSTNDIALFGLFDF